MVIFCKQRTITPEGNVPYELEEEVMVLNNVSKFHKIPIKSIRLREQTLFQMMDFPKQRAITPEGIV